jgi:hypothetical protein
MAHWHRKGQLRDENDAVLGFGGGPGFFDLGEGDGAGVDVDGAGRDLLGQDA